MHGNRGEEGGWGGGQYMNGKREEHMLTIFGLNSGYKELQAKLFCDFYAHLSWISH